MNGQNLNAEKFVSEKLFLWLVHGYVLKTWKSTPKSCCINVLFKYKEKLRSHFLYAFLWLLFWYYLHRILYFAQKWSNFPSEHRLKCHLFCARCATRNVRLSYLWTWCNAILGIYIWLKKDGVFFQQKKKLKNQIIFLLWFDLSVSLLSKWNFVRLKRFFYLENVVFFPPKYVVLLRFNADL